MALLKYVILPVTLFGSYVGYHVVRRLIRNYDLKHKPPNKVIFFTDANAQCRKTCLERKQPCGQECSWHKLKELVDEIDSVKVSLDVCMYLVTCNDLTKAILNAHRRNVRVRLILDQDMATSSESKVHWFHEAGLEIRSISTAVLMHHKFCILDYGTRQQKLITGSLNWTLQGLAGNYEYVSIITTRQPIDSYQAEFNVMWNSFGRLRTKT